ncbi:MAG: class I SAM-dependent methyltransferase [Calditrichaeota bacterium]|nr:class I SAM-dependent methyltransferase [Calditrichota bacterium]
MASEAEEGSKQEWERYGKGRAILPKPRWSNIAEYTSAAYDRQVQQMLDDNLLPGQMVVDLGCGEGRWVEHLLRRGVRCVGADLLVSNARVTCARTRLASGRALAVVADAAHLPFKPHRFDAFISFGLLEHFRNHVPVLEGWTRLLREGGRAIISVPNACRKDWIVYEALHQLVLHRKLVRFYPTVRGLVSRSYGYEERWTPAYFRQLCRLVGFTEVKIHGLFLLLPLLFHPLGDRIPPALFRRIAPTRRSAQWGLYLFAVARR